MTNLPTNKNNNEIVKKERNIHGSYIYRNLSEEEAAKIEKAAETAAKENKTMVNILNKKSYSRKSKEVEE